MAPIAARSPITPLAILLLALLALAPQVHAQQQRLPSIVTGERLDTLQQRLVGLVVPLRSRIDLGEDYRPRYVDGDGAAAFVALPDGTAAWISAFAHLANAETVELYVNDQWVPATPAYGTILFDLVRLDVDPAHQPPIERALPIAEAWPSDGSVYSLAGILEGETPEPIVFGLGARPEGEYAFYVRSLAILRNGYPVVALDGTLLAVSSFAAPDRAGGVFAIPFDNVRAWITEWPRLRGAAGWEPRVIEQRFNLTTGPEVLGVELER